MDKRSASARRRSMKAFMYTIYDKVACESGPVFEAKNDAVAIRHFSMVMTKCPDTTEFQLLKVAEIDHDTNVVCGTVIPEEIEVNLKNTDALYDGRPVSMPVTGKDFTTDQRYSNKKAGVIHESL